MVDIDLEAQAQVGVLGEQFSQLQPLVVREDESDEPGGGIGEFESAPAEFAPADGVGQVANEAVADDGDGPQGGQPGHDGPGVKRGQDDFAANVGRPGAIDGFISVKDDYLSCQSAARRCGTPLDDMPGALFVVDQPAADRRDDVAGGAADVGGLVNDPSAGADGASGGDGVNFGFRAGLAEASGQGARGLVEFVE